MEEMIGYCGYNCHLCAARSEDPGIRQTLVEGWRKYFGHENYSRERTVRWLSQRWEKCRQAMHGTALCEGKRCKKLCLVR